ncbi:hypothetical protein [Streptomyces paludis]|uniref:Uncharacterized protein n=1 Tax=Streptomyces paludis TaxID=2282738 RepID=A0A345HQT2_9ACTN|nr:hypothetical protein [Streptomyces paludis]AXG79056.1 hypothetical protein DVK44_16695 [Streptomyces paludis]
MMKNPNMVFSMDPDHGLVARSDWQQTEAQTVLLDLGWEWSDDAFGLLPPDDVPDFDAGVAAVDQLHLYGQVRTGFSVQPYGTMPLPVARAEEIFAEHTGQNLSEWAPFTDDPNYAKAEPRRPTHRDAMATYGTEPVTIEQCAS